MTKRYYKFRETHRTVRGRRQKYCTTCKRWKDEGDFRKDRAKRDGLKIRCRNCDDAYGQEYRRKHRGDVKEYLSFEERHRTVDGVRQKLCTGCKRWKDEGDFHRDRSFRDGLALQCIECRAGHGGKHRKGNARSRRRNLGYAERHRVVRGVKQKLCGGCNQWKDHNHFYRNGSTTDGLGFHCKECHTRYARERCGRKNESVRRNLRYEERHLVVDGIREKLCTKCRKWKKESEYYTDRARKDGLTGLCRKCSDAATAKSRK